MQHIRLSRLSAAELYTYTADTLMKYLTLIYEHECSKNWGSGWCLILHKTKEAAFASANGSSFLMNTSSHDVITQ